MVWYCEPQELKVGSCHLARFAGWNILVHMAAVVAPDLLHITLLQGVRYACLAWGASCIHPRFLKEVTLPAGAVNAWGVIFAGAAFCLLK